MARGTLRVYLGAAPGVGKTFAMLNEGRRRRDRGTDVVVGIVETHGRPLTAAQVGDLQVLARKPVTYRESAFEEMDLDTILERHPEVVLVDELAHTNVPGSRNTKRWEDVEELLAAGIDVISTVNIQHLESINDVVERITGIAQRETIPDHVVRSAEQIELVDMTPEALRRRMAHGNIYAPEKVDAALTNYFREGNLGALRELALLWVADQVDVTLESYRERHGITEPWETRERVAVAVTGAPGTADLIRRAARVAQRTHGELLGVHVVSQQGLVQTDHGVVPDHRRLLEEVGGEFHEVAGGDVAVALIDFARTENCTQLVLGASRQSCWQELTRGSVISRTIKMAWPIDVLVVSEDAKTAQEDDPAAGDPGPRATSLPRTSRRNLTVNPRRRLIAWLLTVVGLPAMTAALASTRDHIGLPTVLVLFLLFVVVDAAIGGFLVAMVAAAVGFGLVNWYFTPPLHTLTVHEGENVAALVAYLLTAAIVSTLVALAARRTAEAARAGAEARTLSALASTVVDTDPLPAVITHLRRAFALDGAALLRDGPEGWVVEAIDGRCATDPAQAEATHMVAADLVLVLEGGNLAAEDHQVLNAFAANLAMALDRRDLHNQAAQAAALQETNELRSALLQAVSHDLRTPLAGIKASVNSLRQPDLSWTPEEVAEFLATVEDETDRLSNLVDNLLDMSRINADAVSPNLRPTFLDEVVPAAVASLGPRGRTVNIEVTETTPAVDADPGLLERVLANLIDNAVAHSPADSPVRVEVGETAGRVMVRVVDRGPGVTNRDRERVFQPFQRMGDSSPRAGAGVGLGLAVARGFSRAMGGDVTIEDTPGGGATFVVDLEVAG
jgi:two-component system sensor histidine kinase KdpD